MFTAIKLGNFSLILNFIKIYEAMGNLFIEIKDKGADKPKVYQKTEIINIADTKEGVQVTFRTKPEVYITETYDSFLSRLGVDRIKEV